MRLIFFTSEHAATSYSGSQTKLHPLGVQQLSCRRWAELSSLSHALSAAACAALQVTRHRCSVASSSSHTPRKHCHLHFPSPPAHAPGHEYMQHPSLQGTYHTYKPGLTPSAMQCEHTVPACAALMCLGGVAHRLAACPPPSDDLQRGTGAPEQTSGVSNSSTYTTCLRYGGMMLAVMALGRVCATARPNIKC